MDKKEKKINSNNTAKVNAEGASVEGSIDTMKRLGDGFKDRFGTTFSIARWTWALILIGFGVIALLNNFDQIPDGIGYEVLITLFMFWPLLLILAGIQIAFGKSWFTKILISLIILALLFFVFAISMFNANVKMFDWVGEVVPDMVIDIVNTSVDQSLSE